MRKITLKQCVICGKPFNAYPPSRAKGIKCCSPECRHIHQSKVMTGHKMKLSAKKKLIKALKSHKRTIEHCKNISKALIGKFSGKDNPNWQGGMYKSQGRLYIRINNHPFKYQNGYILNSRYVAEGTIGRHLTSEESVHHLNFKKDDDRPENIYIFPCEADHSRYHQLLKANKVKPITQSNLSNY